MVEGCSRGGSGQLEDWAAGVAADLDLAEGADRRQLAGRGASPAPQSRNGAGYGPSAASKKRQLQERDSSPEEDDDEPHGRGGGAKGDSRPKLPRPEKKEPCPRCSSMDTKFCYYNNYNIKQPRFYCKACQRYWTAGGTLRNIAPGSGRRKSKSKAICREKGSPSLAEQLTAAGHGMFCLPSGVGYNGLNPALTAAGLDPTGLLGANGSGAYGHSMLAGHGSLGGLKLSGMGSLPSQYNGELALREHMAHQHSIDARLLLNGHLSGEDLPGSMSAAALAQASAQLHALQGQANGYGNGSGGSSAAGNGNGHSGSPSPSPPPHHHGGQQQHPLASSPQQGGGSQASQQPSPPQQQHGCGSEDLDAADDVYVAQGRRVRIKTDLDGSAAVSSLNGGGASSAYGGGNIASIANAQLAASLTMPPSMASLAAVMGPGGGPSALHPLLCQQDNGGSLLDSGLTRQQLLMLQQHQAMQQAQQQESLQQLHGLLQPHGGLAALQGQHSAAVAALDPLQRSALLHSAGLGGMGSWLQGGAAAAALESLHAQQLSAAASASGLLPQGALLGSGGNSAAAQMLQAQAAAAAAAAGSNWQSATSAAATSGAPPYWPSVWSSYGGPTSANYAGYALQAAAAAAYSSGR